LLWLLERHFQKRAHYILRTAGDEEMLAALIRPVGNLHWLVDRAAFLA
jgi:hypothetical protein